MKEIPEQRAGRFSFSSLRVRLQLLVWIAIIPMALLVVSENLLDRSRKEAEIREQVIGLVNLAEASLFAARDLKWLDRLWENIKLMPDSTFTVTDRRGIILFHYPLPSDKWIGKNMAHLPLVRTMLAQGKGVTEADGPDTINRLYAFTTTETPEGRMHLTVGVSKKAAMRPIYNSLAFSFLVLVAVAASGIFLARLYADRYILKPIKALRDAAGRFAAGEYSSRIKLSDGENELIAFTRVFDEMAETLEAKTKDLRLFRELIDKSNDAIFIADPETGRFLDANERATANTGYSREELLTMHVMDLDTDTADKSLWKEHSARIREQGHIIFETLHKRKDGTTFPVEINTRYLSLEGHSYFVGIVRDVTERKKSEAMIENILESVDEGFIIIDPEYRIISANRAYCEQVKSADCDILGRHCHEISHHLDKPCFMAEEECAPRQTFRTGEPHMALHTHYDKEGVPVYVETKSFPMKDSSGRIFAVIETLNNITEKRRLEDQLRHAQKMEAIGTLAGGIAHDFNNMLNIIIGYGGMMQMKMRPDDPQMDQLKEILAASDRAAQLARGLLTFSRKQVMEIRTVNINEIVEGFKKMLTRIIGEDIDLEITLSEKDLTAKADIVQIEQVMMNLAVNARDAMPKGGVLTIQTQPLKIDREFIRAHGYGEPGKYALITVSDTGIGMDEKTRDRIFEPYFTTKELGRGTGLGLAIVYGIVTQHNGYIRCYSEPGKGTTFRIYIPLVKAAAEKLEKEEALAPVSGTETILLSEDDTAVRGLIRHILEGFGYTVIEAVDGNDAVNKFKENKDKIQLFLSDLIMPGKNGKDAYEEIKVMRQDIRVIFISGYARDIIQRFGIEEGVEFISKPVLPTELLRKVREELDK